MSLQSGRSSARGATTIMITAVLSILLLLAVFLLNIVHYYTFKTSLHLFASQISAAAAHSLPNPKRTFDSAKHAFNVFSKNLSDPSGTSFFAPDLSMRVLISYIDNSGQVQEVLYDPILTPSQTIPLPILGVKIDVSATFNPRLMQFSGSATDGLVPLTLHAKSKAQLTATDVVLVIENSNSLISPLENEASFGSIPPFSMWEDEMQGWSAPLYGSTRQSLKKSLVAARQCFGQVAYDMKRAAVALYDLLSASATYRVAVMHTNAIEGESAETVIPIGPASYTVPYERVIDPPTGVGEYASVDYQDSRCAALTSLTQFQVPAHPLTGQGIASSTLLSSMSSMLRCAGNPSAACAGNAHLEFDSTAPTPPKLLGREVIWMSHSGRSSLQGITDPKADWTYMNLALMRAHDILRDAPKREDNLPVRKKVILVLTDGFEKPFTQFDSTSSSIEDRVFTRVKEDIKTVSFTPESYDFIPNSGSTLVEQGIFEDYCTKEPVGNPMPNLINAQTDIDTSASALPLNNTLGVKLGVLYYGFREQIFSTLDPLDPLNALKLLKGHSSADSANFRVACNNRWTAQRSRFLAEASPTLHGPTGNKAYFERLAPAVARSLFVAEVTQ